MRQVIAVAVVALFLIISGCASKGGSQYAQEMDNLIGKGDKKLFMDKYGIPDKQVALDEGADVWEYRLDERQYTSSTGYRFATFDLLRLSFKGGKLSGWSKKSEVK